MDITDIERRHDLAGGNLALAKPGELYIVYLPEGGEVKLAGLQESLPFRWFNPQKGEWNRSGQLEPGNSLSTSSSGPWVLIVGDY